MQTEKLNEEKKIFDQTHYQCCQCKFARRKVGEALRRMKDWLNKNEEPIPKEFEHLIKSNDQERLANIWSRFL